MRYEVEADAPFLHPARLLLDVGGRHRAEVLGIALRLAYTLSAGTPDLLAGTGLRMERGQLVLRLQPNSGVFAGEAWCGGWTGWRRRWGCEADAREELAEVAAE